jgi:hypothetical protein
VYLNSYKKNSKHSLKFFYPQIEETR